MALSAYNMRGQSALEVGDQVPSFSLKDQLGKTFDLNDYIGKKAYGHLFLSER